MTVASPPDSSDAEVAEQVAQEKTNDVPSRASRSVGDIVRSNVFTRINAILGVLFMIVLATRIPGSTGFVRAAVIANNAIRIIQGTARRRHWASPSSVRPGPGCDGSRGCRRMAAQPGGARRRDRARPGDQIVVDGETAGSHHAGGRRSLLTGEADPDLEGGRRHRRAASWSPAPAPTRDQGRPARPAAARLAEEASKFTLVKSNRGINRSCSSSPICSGPPAC